MKRLSRIVPAHRVTWEFTWIKPDFMLFGLFQAARARMRLDPYTTCRWCRKAFTDPDMIALAGRPKGANVLLCQACAKEATQSETSKEAEHA